MKSNQFALTVFLLTALTAVGCVSQGPPADDLPSNKNTEGRDAEYRASNIQRLEEDYRNVEGELHISLTRFMAPDEFIEMLTVNDLDAHRVFFLVKSASISPVFRFQARRTSAVTLRDDLTSVLEQYLATNGDLAYSDAVLGDFEIYGFEAKGTGQDGLDLLTRYDKSVRFIPFYAPGGMPRAIYMPLEKPYGRPD